MTIRPRPFSLGLAERRLRRACCVSSMRSQVTPGYRAVSRIVMHRESFSVKALEGLGRGPLGVDGPDTRLADHATGLAGDPGDGQDGGRRPAADGQRTEPPHRLAPRPDFTRATRLAPEDPGPLPDGEDHFAARELGADGLFARISHQGNGIGPPSVSQVDLPQPPATPGEGSPVATKCNNPIEMERAACTRFERC